MTSTDRLIKVGPAETGRHRHTVNFDLRGCNEISQIFVSAGKSGITAIQFQYVENGKYVLSDQYGYGNHTTKFHTIELNHPAEYITGVSGQFYIASDLIKVITFTTNMKEYGPFGVLDPNMWPRRGNPQSFTFDLGNSRQFGGFHGIFNSWGLLSIGLYLSAKTVTPTLGLKIPKKEA
ncbi:unnamed protein product [Arabis nemorensis]|uniref:Jacalin-type lectin domain-containing protein n=1 Tax=Arabis nemorensis TaxID=586526 RepID=A0A565AL20_9BRAS|nr:unnamed protein product [Arabis nemorensis]